jgi:hypothetical protein
MVPPPETRRPLTSTNVRCEPNPRNEALETPPEVTPDPLAVTVLVFP